MNKVYRIIRSATGKVTVASELAKSHGKSGGRSALMVGMLMMPCFGMAQDVTLSGFNPHENDHQIGATVVSDGGTVNLTGSLATVENGTNGTQKVATLQTLIDEGKVISGIEFIGATRIGAIRQELNITVEDHATGSSRTVTVIDNNTIVELPQIQSNLNIALGQENVAQYIDLRLGTVDSSGGTLNVDLDNSSLTKSIVAKQTALVLADGSGTNASNVNWNSKNTIDFNATQVVPASEGKIAVSRLAQFPGTYTAYDGTQFLMQSMDDLKLYNSWLIKKVEAGELDQAGYTAEFYKSFKTPTEYITYELPPGAFDGEITEDSGLVNVIRATGANATGILTSSGALTIIGSGGSIGGIMRAEKGGKIINDGTVSLVRTTRGEYDGNAFVITDVGSQGLNRGTINSGFTAKSDGSIESVGIAYGIGARVSNKANFENAADGVINVALNRVGDGGLMEGVRVESQATASNRGVINVGVNGTTSSLYGAVGARVYASGSSFVNEDGGTIYLGRGPQTDASATSGDVVLKTSGNGVLAGISQETTGAAKNAGRIVLGTKTQGAVGMRALNTGAVGQLDNSGIIDILGAVEDAVPSENVGIAAINAIRVTHSGTINIGEIGERVVNAVALKAYDAKSGASKITSTGVINMNGDASPDRRNYGAWAQGDNSEIVLAGGGVNLNGNGAIGVHAREAGKITVEGGAVNFLQGENQIGFFAYGKNADGKASTIDIKSSPAAGLNVSTAGSTLFRVEDGAQVNNSTGAKLIASGERSTALHASGVGSVADLNGMVIEVSGTDAVAVRVDGGATGSMNGKPGIDLKEDGATAVVVDNNKRALDGSETASAPGVRSTFTNNTDSFEISGAKDMTAFLVKNGAQLVNAGNIHVTHGTAIEVVGPGSSLVGGANGKRGTITVDDGVAGIHVHAGAILSTADTITVDNSATGVLVGADAGRVVVEKDAHISGKGSSYGNLITNQADVGTTLVDGATLEMVGSGAALLTENNLDAASHGHVIVSSEVRGKGIALSNADGSQSMGSLTLGENWDIQVSGNGAGVYANTIGDLTIDGAQLAITGSSAATGIRIDAADQVRIAAGSQLSTQNANATLISGNPTTLINGGTLAAASVSAQAVDLDDGGHAFLNEATGKITGAVSLGNGTNRALLKNGSMLDGALLGGIGNDTVTVQDKASFTVLDGGVGGDDKLVFDGAHYAYYEGAGAIRNFDTVQLSNNSTVTMRTQMNVADNGASNLIEIDAGSILAVAPSTTGAFVLDNALKGAGTVSTDMRGHAFDFGVANAASTAANFTGMLALGDSTLELRGANTTALTRATLQAGTDSITHVGEGVQHIGGLQFNGGTVAFDASLPEDTVASGIIRTDKLDVSGAGSVVINVPAPYVPSAPDTPNTANLLEQDDGNIMVKLVELTVAGSPVGGGADLLLKDQSGNVITDKREVEIAQGGKTVAKGTYDYRLSTGAQQDGLYASYGLKLLDLQQDQTLTLEQAPGAIAAAADMSAKIIGSGNLAIDAGPGTVSVSGSNTYSGETTVKSGTLQLNADNALGQTRKLHVAQQAAIDLNGRTQTIGKLDGQAGSTLHVNGGTLNIAEGGVAYGALIGSGVLNVQGGTLDVHGANGALTARTGITAGAAVQLDDIAGLGSGQIANDGSLAIAGATGLLVNDISGAGNIELTQGANVRASSDNTDFAGEFMAAKGTVLTVSEAKNLGSAKVTNEGQLVVDTSSDWTLSNAVYGAGDLVKQGGGTLTAGDALTYAGKTHVNAGTLIVGAADSPNVSLGASGAAGAVHVAQGATIAGLGKVNGQLINDGTVSALNALPGQGSAPAGEFTLANGLINQGTIRLAGASVGNSLVVQGDYVGNNGLLHFNTVLGDDNSLTDHMVVNGNTSGTTRVSVYNAGGLGARTLNGIELIQVNGQSAGEFEQSGRIVAGAYDYSLIRGTGSNAANWYLSNYVDEPKTPVDPETPVAPEIPTEPGQQTQRPEAGSYMSNLAEANTMFVTRLHDRLGETQYIDVLTGERKVTSMWMRNEGGHNRSRDASGQLQTQSNRYVLQLGGDIAQWSNNDLDRFHLGVMAGYGNSKNNTRSNRSGYSSHGSVDGYNLGVYGTWYANDEDKSGLYVDSWAQYSWFNNSVQGEGLSNEEYKSKGVTASVESGYTFKLGENKEKTKTYFIQPKAQITWMGIKADDHREVNGTHVSGQGDGNIQTRLGVRAYMNGHNAIDNGKEREFQPFVETNWIHNSKHFGTTMNGAAVTQAGTKNIGELKLGLEGQINKQLNVWGNVGQQVGDKGYSDTGVMLGVKYNF